MIVLEKSELLQLKELLEKYKKDYENNTLLGNTILGLVKNIEVKINKK